MSCSISFCTVIVLPLFLLLLEFMLRALCMFACACGNSESFWKMEAPEEGYGEHSSH